MNNCFLYNEKGDFLKRVFKISLIVTLLDQIVKNLLLLFMNFGNSYSIIKDFFSINKILTVFLWIISINYNLFQKFSFLK